MIQAGHTADLPAAPVRRTTPLTVLLALQVKQDPAACAWFASAEAWASDRGAREDTSGTTGDQGIDQGVHWCEEQHEGGLWVGIAWEPRTGVAPMRDRTLGEADVR